ncbi:hypothetical protein BDZ97DRAFT_2076699 [Flammula alnicola]|nr:hypothetical protein BDZ97DRAFT_2076699 [Flammula alnicola]
MFTAIIVLRDMDRTGENEPTVEAKLKFGNALTGIDVPVVNCLSMEWGLSRSIQSLPQMKFSIITVSASLAFCSQAFAMPSPQSDPATKICTVDGLIPCPPRNHCCPKYTTGDIGYCLFLGAMCIAPTPI